MHSLTLRQQPCPLLLRVLHPACANCSYLFALDIPTSQRNPWPHGHACTVGRLLKEKETGANTIDMIVLWVGVVPVTASCDRESAASCTFPSCAIFPTFDELVLDPLKASLCWRLNEWRFVQHSGSFNGIFSCFGIVGETLPPAVRT